MSLVEGGRDRLAATSASALSSLSLASPSSSKERGRRSSREEGRRGSTDKRTSAYNATSSTTTKERGGKGKGKKGNQHNDQSKGKSAKAWDDDLNNEGRFYHPQGSSGRAMRVYRNLLTNASVPNRGLHLYHIKHFQASKSIYMEGPSMKLYKDLVEARQFDEFCRPVPKQVVEKEDKVEKLKLDFMADEEDEEAQRILDNRKLITPAWKIGYKPALHHPVGSTKHQNNMLNSEGNEVYFSYDGDWSEGKMHGSGTYQFMDGHKHEGLFRKGWMHGPCTVTYPPEATYQGDFTEGRMEGEGSLTFSDGSKYEGTWKNGKRHGKGKHTYASGMYYEGDFFVGKFHGRGKMYSPNTEFTFEGIFEEGNIRGFGTLIDPEGKREARCWGGLPVARCFSAAVQQLHREKIAQFNERLSADDRMFAYVRALKLQDYVHAVKTQIAQDRYDQKKERLLERRRKAKELLDKSAKKHQHHRRERSAEEGEVDGQGDEKVDREGGSVGKVDRGGGAASERELLSMLSSSSQGEGAGSIEGSGEGDGGSQRELLSMMSSSRSIGGDMLSERSI